MQKATLRDVTANFVNNKPIHNPETSFFLFLYNGEILYTETQKNFERMIKDKNYKYMGELDSNGISNGPSIREYKP